MKFCKRCLTTDLRPNASFEDDICLACRFVKGSDSTASMHLHTLQEWLREVKSRRRHRGAKYDCVVGVSGGKDSTRQALWVKNRLNLRVLLVCVAYPPKQMTTVGANNLANLMTKGFDLLTVNPAPQLARELSLKSFKQHGNVCTSTEMALFSGVPKIAIEMGIPLIFWGENPALQVGDSAVEGRDAFDGNNLGQLNTLQSSQSGWFDTSNEYKQYNYQYPSFSDFSSSGLQIIYLGAAWHDWDNEVNATLGALDGLSLRPNEKHLTGDISEASMLDEEFTNINMMLKYYKFGFGRASDIMCEKIRAGEITREEAIRIVEEYDGVCDDSIISKYCQYVGVTEEEFWKIAKSFVNPKLFKIPKGRARPIKLFKVGVNFE